jgi:universal stress protein E
MPTYSKILFAVKNPDAPRQPGVDKAIGIAKRLGASLELFHSISTPVFLQVEPLSGNSLEDVRRETLELRRARLEKLAQRARRRGVQVRGWVEWDFPPHEAIVRRAEKCRADLIIAECHQGRRLKPWLMHLTDWELLRTSRLPVLLFKNASAWREPVILAAVDPAHARAKPARLDREIVERATSLKGALRGSLELVHANYPPGFAMVVGEPAIDAVTIAAAYELQKKRAGELFEKFAGKAGIPRRSRHLVDSDPVFAIPHVARKVGADLVVMGAMSRSGLKRVFIGNTAERVLDSLPCDVLVVKPGRARARVASRPRGMRVAGPPPLFSMTA